MLGLLLAPYSALAVLALGRSREFECAAAFSIALTLLTMATTASAMIVGVQYYPRICALVAAGSAEAVRWFGNILRLLAALSLTVAVMLLLFPTEIISLVLPSAYLTIVDPLAGLAPAVVLVTIGVYFAWTLLAHDAGSAAVLGAAVQLLGAAAAVWCALHHPNGFPPDVGTRILRRSGCRGRYLAISLKRSAPQYPFHVARIAAATAATFGVGLTFRSLVGTVSPNVSGHAGLLIAATFCVGAAAAVVLLPEIPRWLFGRGRTAPIRTGRSHDDAETDTAF